MFGSVVPLFPFPAVLRCHVFDPPFLAAATWADTQDPAMLRFMRVGTDILGVDSLSILFNHRSFQKPDPFSIGFRRSSRKIRSDPWKEWGRYP